MARKARKTLDTNVFLIKQTSHEKIFRHDIDREAWITIIAQTQQKFGFECYGYCLLDDHSFKMIINAKKQSISRIMQSMIIAYTRYRQHDERLFLQRFVSKPIYDRQQLIQQIQNIHQKDAGKYNSYCIINKQMDIDYEWLYPIAHHPVRFEQQTEQTTDEQLHHALDEFLARNQCDADTIKNDKQLRNRCIIKLRQETNCSLKQIGELFGGLSESTISKILKSEGHGS